MNLEKMPRPDDDHFFSRLVLFLLPFLGCHFGLPILVLLVSILPPIEDRVHFHLNYNNRMMQYKPGQVTICLWTMNG